MSLQQINNINPPKLIFSALSLPILTIMVFMLVSALPNYLIESPKYSFVYTKEFYIDPNDKEFYNQDSDNIEVRFKVINGKIISECKKNQANTREIQLFIFDANTLSSRRIFYELPNSVNLAEQWTTFVIDELKNLQIDVAKKAPDDYQSGPHYEHFNKGIFISASPNKNVVSKGNRQIVFAPTYSTVLFLGWILNQQYN